MTMTIFNTEYLRGLGYRNDSTGARADGMLELTCRDGRLLILRLMDERDPRRAELLRIQRRFGIEVQASIAPCKGGDQCLRQRTGNGVCRHGYDIHVHVTTSQSLPGDMPQEDYTAIYNKLAEFVSPFYDDLAALYPYAYTTQHTDTAA